jgi:hypothetical protein
VLSTDTNRQRQNAVSANCHSAIRVCIVEPKAFFFAVSKGHIASLAIVEADEIHLIVMSDSPSKVGASVSRVVLRDAIKNCGWFAVGTVVIIIVGRVSRVGGLTLAGVETLFVVIQSLKVLFILFSDAFLFLSGRREPDEKDLRLASVTRILELSVWLSCILILYRFFFPR